MRIGEIAERVGVNPKTIRFYESIGVIPEPPRTTGGYRDYEESHVERLRFVRAAQRLGLKLKDIAEVLAFRDREERPCDFVVEVVRREVELLGSRIAEMRRLKGDLEGLLDRADELQATEGGKYCPLIHPLPSHGCEHRPAGVGEGAPKRLPTQPQANDSSTRLRTRVRERMPHSLPFDSMPGDESFPTES